MGDTMTSKSWNSARAIPFLKSYTVFNIEQIDGLPERSNGRPEPKAEQVGRIERAEEFFAATMASIVHGGSRACYVPSRDQIHMPCIDCFRDAESYYATLAHEATHNAEFRIMPRRLSSSLLFQREVAPSFGITLAH